MNYFRSLCLRGICTVLYRLCIFTKSNLVNSIQHFILYIVKNFCSATLIERWVMPNLRWRTDQLIGPWLGNIFTFYTMLRLQHKSLPHHPLPLCVIFFLTFSLILPKYITDIINRINLVSERCNFTVLNAILRLSKICNRLAQNEMSTWEAYMYNNNNAFYLW